jgi:CheY-like chemotaxis protein
LSALLSSIPSIEVAGVAVDGQEAVRAAVTLHPDVMVMDIQLPGLSGVAATREIARVAPNVAVPRWRGSERARPPAELPVNSRQPNIRSAVRLFGRILPCGGTPRG